MEHWNNAVETLYSEMMDKPREVLEISGHAGLAHFTGV